MLESLLSPDFFNAILRATTPILFAALASSVASKSGITNMALEGIMLFSALFGVIFSAMTGNWAAGLLLTMLAGGIIGLLLAFFVLNLKTDEILAAIAINLMATGGTVLLMLAVSGDRGSSTSIASQSVPRLVIPLVDRIPFLGQILSGQNGMTYLALLAVAVMHLFLYKTPLGLKIRAVGENKNAAESVGISARKIQYIALILSGVLASMGGFFLSGGYMNMFTKDMSAGKGYIALAASAMGGDTPIGAFLVSLLFGAAQALANMMQLTDIPHELIQMVPYLTTLVGLGIYSYTGLKRRQKLAGK
ncbi:MAG: ABC transporter permease [Lachnospiraceae bacterium]|nr:ABC transporter permease [Lachnospiraceae bacterium]